MSVRKKTKSRKTFIIDTSVLLYDKNALRSFPGNDVVIPLIVLDELDRHKEKPGMTGENARAVNRFLDKLRDDGQLHNGVLLEDIDQKIRVESRDFPLPSGMENIADNKIIGTALGLRQSTKSDVIVVTKDINFRVKCDALDLKAEDYYKDNIRNDIPESTTFREVLVDDDLIDEIYADLEIDSARVFGKVEMQCEPLVLKSNSGTSKSALCFLSGGEINLLKKKKISGPGHANITGKNKEQEFAIYALLDHEIEMTMLTGIAGSGKTFLALMAGLYGLHEKKYKRIVITRPMQAVGKDMGFLPGDVNEKIAPWMSPIVDNFREGTGDNGVELFEMMVHKGQIEIAPLAFIRGRTFNDSFIIVDEAQNATIHELKTIITRAGKGSKIVLLGDIDQVDTPYLDRNSNGLSIVIDRFKNQPISCHIALPKSQRSDLAAIAGTIL